MRNGCYTKSFSSGVRWFEDRKRGFAAICKICYTKREKKRKDDLCREHAVFSILSRILCTHLIYIYTKVNFLKTSKFNECQLERDITLAIS